MLKVVVLSAGVQVIVGQQLVVVMVVHGDPVISVLKGVTLKPMIVKETLAFWAVCVSQMALHMVHIHLHVTPATDASYALQENLAL